MAKFRADRSHVRGPTDVDTGTPTPPSAHPTNAPSVFTSLSSREQGLAFLVAVAVVRDYPVDISGFLLRNMAAAVSDAVAKTLLPF